MDLENPTPEELAQLKQEFACGPGKLMVIPDVQPQWPGYVSREHLANWCREYVLKIGPENDNLIKAMENSKGLSDEEYESLHIKYSSNLGRQLALFDLMKWAAKNNKSQEEMQSEEMDRRNGIGRNVVS